MSTSHLKYRSLRLLILMMVVLSVSHVFAEQDNAHQDPLHESQAHSSKHDIHWTYGDSNWGSVSRKYEDCDGHQQSPVNIVEVEASDLVDITFDYQDVALHIVNNGHTIQADVREYSTITYDNTVYKLRQFHFHHPSEHSVNGVRVPMEVHFVHQDPITEKLAVVGVLLTAGNAHNEDYAFVFDNLPTEENNSILMDGLHNLSELLPENRLYTTYSGSLTTPPCSEIVTWLVLKDFVALSTEQISQFATLYPMNARPVQDIHNRELSQDNN